MTDHEDALMFLHGVGTPSICNPSQNIYALECWLKRQVSSKIDIRRASINSDTSNSNPFQNLGGLKIQSFHTINSKHAQAMQLGA
jgi:hypothetical protein